MWTTMSSWEVGPPRTSCCTTGCRSSTTPGWLRVGSATTPSCSAPAWGIATNATAGRSSTRPSGEVGGPSARARCRRSAITCTTTSATSGSTGAGPPLPSPWTLRCGRTRAETRASTTPCDSCGRAAGRPGTSGMPRSCSPSSTSGTGNRCSQNSRSRSCRSRGSQTSKRRLTRWGSTPPPGGSS